MEITEPEVAQALPAALEREDNNNCEKNVEVCGWKYKYHEYHGIHLLLFTILFVSF